MEYQLNICWGVKRTGHKTHWSGGTYWAACVVCARDISYLNTPISNAPSVALPDSWGTPGAFPNLEELKLTNLQLSGTLPNSWGERGSFPKLKVLNLATNIFSGSLPESWSSLASLTSINLSDNNLTGKAPCARCMCCVFLLGQQLAPYYHRVATS